VLEVLEVLELDEGGVEAAPLGSGTRSAKNTPTEIATKAWLRAFNFFPMR
jgi:hypothetical protein